MLIIKIFLQGNKYSWNKQNTISSDRFLLQKRWQNSLPFSGCIEVIVIALTHILRNF